MFVHAVRAPVSCDIRCLTIESVLYFLLTEGSLSVLARAEPNMKTQERNEMNHSNRNAITNDESIVIEYKPLLVTQLIT